MRILYWTGLFWPHIGGVEVLSLQFIPAMQERGHEFIVLTSQSKPGLSSEANYKGILIYRFPFHKGLVGHNLKELKETRQKVVELKKTFKPDLVHLNSIDASLFFHLATDAIDKVHTLFTVHSLPPYIVDDNTLLRKMLYSARWITTASEAMLMAVHGIATEITTRSSLIHYGLKMPSLESTPLSFDPPRLLCLGRVVSDKGFDIALDAFAKIIGLFPSARLVIAGDGNARPDLELQAVRQGVAGAVEFTGWISPEKVPELINTATVVIVPSRWEEPFGLVALQAAQMARPVVAARAGGLPEIVEHQKTGLLFEKGNSTALAEQVKFLLEHPETAAQLGHTAQKRAKSVFGFERFINAYDDLYKKLAVSSSVKS